eukprot:GSChrysophyteH1.ASY1.ANO1.2546.1 assembled CDS
MKQKLCQFPCMIKSLRFAFSVVSQAEHPSVPTIARSSHDRTILPVVQLMLIISAMPFCQTLSDFWSFDWSTYDAIKPNGNEIHDALLPYYPMFYPTAVPVLSVLAYLFLSDPIMSVIRSMLNGAEVKDQNGKRVKNSFDHGMKWLTIVHSLALTVYSGWTFINAYRIVSGVAVEYMASGLTFYEAFIKMSCDNDGYVWVNKDFGFWVSHFYISKYWEFLDTWIILLKGKKPMLLQTYHHAGVVLIMWMFVACHNTACGMMITVLNSGIHTMMYAYFTITAFEFKFLYKFKPLITSAQLIQFVTGIAMTIPCYFVEGCQTEAQFYSQIAIHSYTLYLMYLFVEFAKKEYIQKPKSKSS